MSDDGLAYVLSRDEAGWSWQVMNWDGEIVAAGFELIETAAHGAIAAILHNTGSRSFEPVRG